jgi:hypothetical protein
MLGGGACTVTTSANSANIHTEYSVLYRMYVCTSYSVDSADSGTCSSLVSRILNNPKPEGSRVTAISGHKTQSWENEAVGDGTVRTWGRRVFVHAEYGIRNSHFNNRLQLGHYRRVQKQVFLFMIHAVSMREHTNLVNDAASIKGNSKHCTKYCVLRTTYFLTFSACDVLPGRTRPTKWHIPCPRRGDKKTKGGGGTKKKRVSLASPTPRSDGKELKGDHRPPRLWPSHL